MTHPIRAYREKHGLTLEAFGALVGLQRSAVWKRENGMAISLTLASKIEEVTGGEVTVIALAKAARTVDPSALPAPAASEGAAA